MSQEDLSHTKRAFPFEPEQKAMKRKKEAQTNIQLIKCTSWSTSFLFKTTNLFTASTSISQRSIYIDPRAFSVSKNVLMPIRRAAGYDELRRMGFPKRKNKGMQTQECICLYKEMKKRKYTTSKSTQLKMLQLANDGFRFCDIAKCLRLSASTVRRTVIRLKALFPANIQALIEAKRGRKELLSPQQGKFIRDFYKNPANVSKPVTHLRRAMHFAFDLSTRLPSLSTLRRAMKKMGLTLKRLTLFKKPSGFLLQDSVRQQFATQFLACRRKNMKIVFIDESSFNLSLQPFYGYSLKGTPALMSKAEKGTSITLLAAMSEEGIVAMQMFRGFVKKLGFLGFVYELLFNMKALDEPNNIVLVCDNASVHTSKIFRAIITAKYHILYTPPGTPQFNAIEFAFSVWKAKVRLSMPASERALIIAIIAGGRSLTFQQCLAWTNHTGSFISEAFQGRKISEK